MRDGLRRELDRGRLRYVAHFDARTGADWVFSLNGGKGPRPRDVDVFLYGAATCTQSVAGTMDDPSGGHVLHGAGVFRGWASSPHGIRSVDLWFNNRRVKIAARLKPLDIERCPGPPPVQFQALFGARPENVREKTDVQAEVTDGRGRKTVFEDRWISWEDLD
jgi:hypothetical protein